MKLYQILCQGLACTIFFFLQAMLGGCGQNETPAVAEIKKARPWADPRALNAKHTGTVAALALNHSGDLLASAGMDSLVIIWHAPSLQAIKTISTGAAISALAFADSTDMLLVGDVEGEIVQWSLPNRTKVESWSGHIGKVVALRKIPNSNLLLSAGDDQKICLWNVETGQKLSYWPLSADIHDLTLSPDGDYFAAAAGSQALAWEMRTREQTHKFSHFSTSEYGFGSAQTAKCVAFGLYDSLLITGADTDLFLWDRHTQKLRKKIRAAYADLTCFAASPNGLRLATGGMDKIISLWDVQNRKTIDEFYGHFNTITALAFSKTGDTLFAGSYDHSITAWQVKTGELLATLGSPVQAPEEMWNLNVTSAWASEKFYVDDFRYFSPSSYQHQMLNVTVSLENLTEAEMVFYSFNLLVRAKDGLASRCGGEVNYAATSGGRYIMHRVAPKSKITGTFVFVVERRQTVFTLEYENLSPVSVSL